MPAKALLVRLPNSVREKAAEFAKEDGVSLNFFITQALAEKLTQFELAAERGRPAQDRQPSLLRRVA